MPLTPPPRPATRTPSQPHGVLVLVFLAPKCWEHLPVVLGSAGVPWGSEEARGSSGSPCLGSGSLALLAEHQAPIGQLCKQNQGPWPAAGGVSRHRGRGRARGHTARGTGPGRAPSPRPRRRGLAQGSRPGGCQVAAGQECVLTNLSLSVLEDATNDVNKGEGGV